MKQIILFIIFLSICVTILNGCAYDETKYPFVLHEYSTPGKNVWESEYRMYFNKYKNLIFMVVSSNEYVIGHDLCKYTIKGVNVFIYDKDTGKDRLHLHYDISKDIFIVTLGEGLLYEDLVGCVFERVK